MVVNYFRNSVKDFASIRDAVRESAGGLAAANRAPNPVPKSCLASIPAKDFVVMLVPLSAHFAMANNSKQKSSGIRNLDRGSYLNLI